MKITDTVDALIRETVENMGYELDEVELAKEHGNLVLTVYIYKDSGITLDDCEAVSHAIDPILDQADPIAQSYYLSVSSIGLDRPLKKDRDFERNLGKKVTVRLYAPLEGKKELTGVLCAFDAQTLTLELDAEKRLAVPRKDASSVKPYIDFSNI